MPCSSVCLTGAVHVAMALRQACGPTGLTPSSSAGQKQSAWPHLLDGRPARQPFPVVGRVWLQRGPAHAHAPASRTAGARIVSAAGRPAGIRPVRAATCGSTGALLQTGWRPLALQRHPERPLQEGGGREKAANWSGCCRVVQAGRRGEHTEAEAQPLRGRAAPSQG